MRIRWGCVLGVVCSMIWAGASCGQEVAVFEGANPDGEARSRLNAWSMAVEVVPTTRHYFLGQAEERRFFAIGGEYARRLHHGRVVGLYYVAELRPVVLEGDPTFAGFENPLTGQPVVRFPEPQRVVFVYHSPTELLPQNELVVPFYGREWTYGASLSPLGIRVNFLAQRRWQPLLETSVGVHLTTRDVPVDGARSFNYTFQVGTGVEWYFHERRSLRYEFMFRHISNAYSGSTNPGVDLPTLRLVYSFGR